VNAAYVPARSHTGYTTNLPLNDATRGKAWGGVGRNGVGRNGSPLRDVHGGPARLLVPYLYFWKSAKWVSRPA
jgi:DMSO/TMAO reductase YedYZ molybdopterin-dependent catalytic subunit